MLIEEYDHHGLSVQILHDECMERPGISYDVLGTIYHCHDRYDIGTYLQHNKLSLMHRQLKETRAVILPVYMYDHSGISLSTRPFHCPWDSFQVGFIAATREACQDAFSWSRLTQKRRNIVKRYLEDEVETLSQWCNGECFRYTITDKEGEELDSCSGFIGLDSVKEAANEYAAYYQPKQLDLPLV